MIQRTLRLVFALALVAGLGLATTGRAAAAPPQAGTTPYACLLHSAQLPNGQVVGMIGSVVVQAAGAAYPKTQAQVDDDTKAMLAADEAATMQLDPLVKDAPTPQAGPNGTMIYNINIGGSDPMG